MSIVSMQGYTRVAKYARKNPATGRRETWHEQVARVFAMHREHLGDRLPTVEADLARAERDMLARNVLGSQRALQFAGPACIQHNARLYNCSMGRCDRPAFFQEALYLLLCGCGVGYSITKPQVAKLPRALPAGALRSTFHVADSIEGWADALGALVESRMDMPDADRRHPAVAGRALDFDFSLVRPRGAPISWGGIAPGPGELAVSLERIAALLDRVALAGGTLRPIDAHDIVMHAADAVLSGGVRRAACLALFSHDDHEMASSKTGQWQVDNLQRARANNSALLMRDGTSFDEFRALMEMTREMGEPGFVWADSPDMVANPCAEVGSIPITADGRSGWGMCNLCEINMKKATTRELFIEACEAAAILGTVQASYDTFPYLGDATREIVRRDALLGVGMTGMADTPGIAFDPATQREGAARVLEVNARLAPLVGVNLAARATVVKPAGTTSCLLGSSSGIHPHHARRYLRRVQANDMEPALAFYRRHNPMAVEKSVWDSAGRDSVITFLCEVPEGARTRNQCAALDLLASVASTQANWIEGGTRDKSAPVRHAVSNTVVVRPDEWDAVARRIYDDRKLFAGVALLPISGDLDYPQAPFTAIRTASEIVREYGDGAVLASGLIVDGLHAFGSSHADLWKACDFALDRRRALDEGDLLVGFQRDWLRRAKKFARNYFGGDVRRACNCMKEVSNWKLWLDLSREHVAVDWSDMDAPVADSTPEAGEACSGGACELGALGAAIAAAKMAPNASSEG